MFPCAQKCNMHAGLQACVRLSRTTSSYTCARVRAPVRRRNYGCAEIRNTSVMHAWTYAKRTSRLDGSPKAGTGIRAFLAQRARALMR